MVTTLCGRQPELTHAQPSHVNDDPDSGGANRLFKLIVVVDGQVVVTWTHQIKADHAAPSGETRIGVTTPWLVLVDCDRGD